MAKVICRAKARGDLLEHFVYLTDNASPATAERFLQCAEKSFADLALRPRTGKALQLRHSALAGMHKWRVRDFNNHLIFYQPDADGVEIVRVLHAASDWWSVLGLEVLGFEE